MGNQTTVTKSMVATALAGLLFLILNKTLFKWEPLSDEIRTLLETLFVGGLTFLVPHNVTIGARGLTETEQLILRLVANSPGIPAPNLTGPTAVPIERLEQILASLETRGYLTSALHPTGFRGYTRVKQQRGVAPGAALFLLSGALVGAPACASINPLGAAETPQQKAYAVYGLYGVVVGQARMVVQDEDVPIGVRRTVKAAVLKADPAVEALASAAQTVFDLEAAHEAGAPVSEHLEIAMIGLERTLDEAQPLVLALAEAVRGAVTP